MSLDALGISEYQNLVRQELNKSCSKEDVKCENQKILFLDLVVHKGDNFSQTFIIKHFLLNPSTNRSYIERVLLHIINVSNPVLVSNWLKNKYALNFFVSRINPPNLRQYIALFAVAKGWLLLDIGWFFLFFKMKNINYFTNYHASN